jgi:hypothetical protein
VPFDDVSLQELLQKARRHNSSVQVTGMLMYEKGVFLQALEGPREKVEALYQKISKDERHNNVMTIVDDDIKERHFGEWSMAYLRSEELKTDSFDGFSRLLEKYQEDTLTEVDTKLVFHLLVLFKERLPVEDALAVAGKYFEAKK